MAEGSQKPIGEVRVGDWVLASDPERGRTQAKQVTDVIVGSGYKQLKRVVAAGRQVVATDEHPFYTANDRSWTDAADLRQGDQLQTADGRLVAVSAIVDADRAATVYNLTVDDLHTYYAGTLPLLVHNTNGGCATGAATGATKGADEGRNGASRTYINITKGKSSVRNVGTDATHTEFAGSLTQGGWASRVSKDGAVQIFSKDGAKYVLREKNSSGYAGWTADYTPAGAKGHSLEIRLGYTP